jgi:prophage regulatory protein
MKLLSQRDLKPLKGIEYSETQIWRKERDGSFPKSIRIGTNRKAWLESEIDAWIKARVAERDAKTQQSAEAA